ncbi:MAG: hypothetical protein AAGA83_17380 [Cyanobacteria bacterium P01_F01_bin.116]
MKLEKAKLIAIASEAEDIEFMFNPNEISFSRSMSLEQAKGSRTKKGQNKTSFKHPNPYSLKIGNIVIDTYEGGGSVLDHIKKYTKAVEFSEKGKADKKRPPIYLFVWGGNLYMRCFVKSFSFKLTLFRADGTPVRATIDLSLEQVDPPNPETSQLPSSVTQGMRNSSSQIFLT